ncbi:MAG TPA: SDR family NAD(P)-dependent oxidoreductase [Candidatus Baltobacteraceae bacterium]|nr:SDR family NAD(P)-dependent oxidoreductase [Candidatus Baltobacteraceae bacterium]
MNTKGNIILITGGATGLGFALAERLVALGNEVIICGRRQDRLDAAKQRLPSVHCRRCDISNAESRNEFCSWVEAMFPNVNMLINNAGIQRKVDLTAGTGALIDDDNEIDINLKAQIYLAERFMPLFLKRKEAAILNVSSGLGFVPMAAFPVYSATKAAIHSFTTSLRFQLRESQVKVFELIPPTIYDTELKGKPIEKAEWNVPVAEVADAAIRGLERNSYEIAVGMAKGWVDGTNADREQAFKNMNH